MRVSDSRSRASESALFSEFFSVVKSNRKTKTGSNSHHKIGTSSELIPPFDSAALLSRISIKKIVCVRLDLHHRDTVSNSNQLRVDMHLHNTVSRVRRKFPALVTGKVRVVANMAMVPCGTNKRKINAKWSRIIPVFRARARTKQRSCEWPGFEIISGSGRKLTHLRAAWSVQERHQSSSQQTQLADKIQGEEAKSPGRKGSSKSGNG